MTLREQILNYKPYNEQEQRDKELMLRYMEEFQDVLTRENPLCHFTASNWIVNPEKTKVIMAYHNIYQSWAWTGGHADGEENLLAVARKEAEEETGLRNLRLLGDGIHALQILTVNSHIKRGSYVAPHLHLDCCFLFEADEAEEIRIKEDENSGIKWMDIDKAVELSTEEQMKPIYEKLNAKIFI